MRLYIHSMMKYSAVLWGEQVFVKKVEEVGKLVGKGSVLILGGVLKSCFIYKPHATYLGENHLLVDL